MKNICYTSLRRTILIVVSVVLMIAVAVGIFLWMLTIEPPFFDENAVLGSPKDMIPVEKGYTYFQEYELAAAYLCQNPDFDGKNVDLFLTNPEENEGLFIRVEIYTIKTIYDKNGNPIGSDFDELLGKSGFIRPGEYVKTVALKKTLDKQTPVALKIGVYEEATGKNPGSIVQPIFLTP